MTTQTPPPSPHNGRQPPPPFHNKSPRTPPPPSRHRSRSREKKSNAAALHAKPPAPTVIYPSSSHQMIAAPPANGHINPQWQIHNSSTNSHQHSHNRKHPPPPPPRPHQKSPRKDNSGSQQLALAAQELHRVYSTGSASEQRALAAQELHRAYSTGSSHSIVRRGSSGSNSAQQRDLNNSSVSMGSHGSKNNKNRARSGSMGSHGSQNRARSGSFHRDDTTSAVERKNSGQSSERETAIAVAGGNGYYSNYSLNNNSSSGLFANSDIVNHQNSTNEEDREESLEGSEIVEASLEGSAEEPPKKISSRLWSALLCLFPKVEPLPWGTFAILTIWCAIPPACFILFFTQMGFGEQIYYSIAIEMGQHAYGLALGLAVIILVLYMLDADEWTSQAGSIFLDLCILAIVCGFVFLVLLIADLFPYGMVCLFAVFHPLWLLALKLMFYDWKDTRVFVSWLSGPLFFTSILIIAAWTAWVFSDPDNEWNIVANMVAAERTGCVPDYEEYPECRKEAGSEETCFYVEKSEGKESLVFPDGCDQSCTDVYNDCLNGFILWVGPVLVSMTSFFLSFFCTFLRTEGAREKDVLNFGAIWIFILFAMWVSTSLAGTAAGVTSALAALTLASFVASAMFVAVSFSKEERSRNSVLVLERVREKYGKHLDVARGLFVVTCAPIVLVYFGLSMTNQFIRRVGIFPCSQSSGEEGDVFTSRTRKQVNIMKSWDRAKVYTYAVYWGIAFMILQVLVANLTVVFLSWMIEKTADFGLAAVTGIMAGVGVMMFLLPPVPGVPVYLTLGIVLPAQGHQLLGWAGAIAYSVGIGLVLKLFSSALQQKMIGENLSHYVKVRQFVGINSTLMKAMRLVLGKDGLSVPKVSILIGGPDWPTSVLCGIMRLSVLQIMLGTLPIVFLIAPTCLTGALLYMASLETDTGNPEFPWAGTVSTITASLTAVVQFGSMLVAAYYLEQTAGKRADEVEAIEVDREVKEADDKAAHLQSCYRDVTQWDYVPMTPKLLLQTSLACIITSSYMVQLFSNSCFTPHSLTDSIDENLDGNVSNLFLPLGWTSLGLFCISIIFIYLFQSWGEQKAYKLANGIVVSPSQSSSERSSSA